jgi:hypothetical protein
MDDEPTPMDEIENKPDDPSEPQEPRPLDYATGYYGQRPSAVRSVFLYIGGFLLGLVGTVAAWVGTFFAAGIEIDGPIRPTAHRGPTILFAGICGGAIAGIIGTVRAYKRGRRHWFLAGFLTGVCLMALGEGICFANP